MNIFKIVGVVSSAFLSRVQVILAIIFVGILSARDVSPTLIASLPLSDRPLLPVVQVEIDHSPVSMMFDTGTSNALVLDPALGAKMQMSDKNESFTVAGGVKIQRKVATVEKIKFGTNYLSDIRAVQVDLQPFRDYIGINYYGIVPMSFTSGQVLNFDFDKGVLEVFDGKLNVPNDWIELPIEIHEGCPCIRLKISSEDVLFLIDTGFNAALEIPTEIFSRLLKKGEVRINPVVGKGLDVAGALEGTKRGWFERGNLMGKALEGVEFRTSKGGAKMGMSWLLAFNFIVDSNDIRFFYKRRANPRAPIAIELMTGAVFRYSKEGLIVERLRPGGGAVEKAGLMVGDVIIQLGEDPEMQLDGPHVYDLIEKSENKKVSCIYRRDGQKKPAHTDIDIGPSQSAWNFGGYRRQ